MLGEVFDFAKECPAILEDGQQMAPRVSENDIAFFPPPFIYLSEFTTKLCEFKSISSMLLPSVLMIDQWKKSEQWTDGDEANNEVKMMMSVWLCEIGA